MEVFDVIFLIFTILVMVIPLVEKIKNPKKEAPSRTLTDIFSDLEENGKAVDADMDPTPKPVFPIRVAKEGTYNGLVEEGTAAFVHESSSKKELVKNTFELEEERKKEGIDLKKLVIYSEIMKPKF